MTWLDLLLLLALFSYTWGGFQAGLIEAIGGLVGLVIGAVVASSQYVHFAPAFAGWVGGNELISKVVAFGVILFVVSRLVAIIIWFVNKLFNIVAIVPGLKLLNKLAGAVFGLLEGALFLGLVLQVANRLPVPDNWAHALQGSMIAPFLIHVSGWLVPFLPAALKTSTEAIKRALPGSVQFNVPVNIPL